MPAYQFAAANGLTPGNNDTAIYCGKVTGWIIVWGLAPFWLSDNNSMGKQGPPPGGFNIEVRNGIYVSGNTAPGTPEASPVPLFLPWNGDLYILNGTGPNDSPVNVVNVIKVPQCS